MLEGNIKIYEVCVVLAYLLVCLAIGVYYSRRATASEEEYWVGGRFLTKTAGAFAVFAVVGSAKLCRQI